MSAPRLPHALVLVGGSVEFAFAVELEATSVELVPLRLKGVLLPLYAATDPVAVGAAVPVVTECVATNLSRQSLAVVPFEQQRVWLSSPG